MPSLEKTTTSRPTTCKQYKATLHTSLNSKISGMMDGSEKAKYRLEYFRTTDQAAASQKHGPNCDHHFHPSRKKNLKFSMNHTNKEEKETKSTITRERGKGRRRVHYTSCREQVFIRDLNIGNQRP